MENKFNSKNKYSKENSVPVCTYALKIETKRLPFVHCVFADRIPCYVKAKTVKSHRNALCSENMIAIPSVRWYEHTDLSVSYSIVSF